MLVDILGSIRSFQELCQLWKTVTLKCQLTCLCTWFLCVCEETSPYTWLMKRDLKLLGCIEFCMSILSEMLECNCLFVFPCWC